MLQLLMLLLHPYVVQTVDRYSRALPSQNLQDVITEVEEVQESSDPGGGGRETLTRKAAGRELKTQI